MTAEGQLSPAVSQTNSFVGPGGEGQLRKEIKKLESESVLVCRARLLHDGNLVGKQFLIVYSVDRCVHFMGCVVVSVLQM